MATFRRWRRDRNWQSSHSPPRSHSPQPPIDIEKYDWKINRFQKSNWGDSEAKEAHASVVKYMWRKEHDLNKKITDLQKQIAKQIEDNPSESCDCETTQKQEIVPAETPNILKQRESTMRELEASMRGIHFRTIEDNTFDNLNLVKSERKLAKTGSYIEKNRSKAHVEDDLSDDLKNAIRGKSAYQISAAILADAEKGANQVKHSKRRELLERLRKERPSVHRGIYDIMADRNRLGIAPPRPHQFQNERHLHADHDPSWNNADYLNLVGYRMQNDQRGFKMQNHGEIIW